MRNVKNFYQLQAKYCISTFYKIYFCWKKNSKENIILKTKIENPVYIIKLRFYRARCLYMLLLIDHIFIEHCIWGCYSLVHRRIWADIYENMSGEATSIEYIFSQYSPGVPKNKFLIFGIFAHLSTFW